METLSIIMLCMTLVSGLFIGGLLLEHQQQASAQMGMQMMNPNMMGNANGTANPNMMGQMMNPGMMMSNGSWMNTMFQQGQNITGSIKVMPSMFNSIASQIKASLSDAADTAQKEVGNKSHVVAAHLGVVNGYLTYTICAVDPDMNIHRLVIDAGNGKVLSSSKLSWQNMTMFNGMMGPMMMNPNMMGNMMGFR